MASKSIALRNLYKHKQKQTKGHPLCFDEEQNKKDTKNKKKDTHFVLMKNKRTSTVF